MSVVTLRSERPHLPAIADASPVFERWNEAWGSLEQLLLNLVLLVIVGAIALDFTRRFWIRMHRRAEAR